MRPEDLMPSEPDVNDVYVATILDCELWWSPATGFYWPAGEPLHHRFLPGGVIEEEPLLAPYRVASRQIYARALDCGHTARYGDTYVIWLGAYESRMCVRCAERVEDHGEVLCFQKLTHPLATTPQCRVCHP
jgi:hypothetical protein